MSVIVRHRNNTIATIPDSTGGTKTLLTEGKYLDSNVQVIYTPPAGPNLGTKIITENGLYDASDDGYDGYSEIDVSVAGGGGYSADDILFGSAPSGDVTYVVPSNQQSRRIMGRTGMTKLTLDCATNSVRPPEYFVQDCIIPTIVIIENQTATNPNYTVTGGGDNNNLFTLVIRGISTGGFSNNALKANRGLKTFDYTYTGNGDIAQYIFQDDHKFDTFIIRGSSVLPLSNINAFTATNTWKSSGTGGTLYVPNSLISAYQSASNWSTILGYTNNQIKSIESTHTDPTAPFDMTLYYADGTPIAA